ncbi:cytochrome c oxidase assembly factor CtaG [Bacillus sp. 03113]|uniref:cytochrome c oxidase assembly factor CtaG n=1 Tax=Bacillus sp. 03113 TaxID=2578211 RepID=UPI0011438570|nr:cytochrome c oxidase assembly factor CtaG [Bacillus sp. 03113]
MWDKIQMFGFTALWSPYFLLTLLLILALYFFLLLKKRNGWGDSNRNKQAIFFTLALLLLYIVKGSPLDLMSHVLFYAHMSQMALLFLLIPPLLIWGLPNWMWRKILSIKLIGYPFLFFTKPILAVILFNVFFSFYHIPLIFDIVKMNMWAHTAATAFLFLLAVFMWWPLVHPLEELGGLSGIKKVAYIFADGVLLTPACALIIFADTPLYATYSNPNIWAEAMSLCVPHSTLATLELSGPEMFSSLSPLFDQQIGGVLMKIIQEVIYGCMLGRVFFRWYKDEQKETADDQRNKQAALTIK